MTDVTNRHPGVRDVRGDWAGDAHTVADTDCSVVAEADGFLRTCRAGTDRTYAYVLVDHLRWLRFAGLDVGADYPGPFGLPWRVGKRPYGHSALKTAVACLKGFYLHLGAYGVNPALAEALRVTRLLTRADRRRAMLGHVLHSMTANPLAPAEQVRQHPKMLPEGARDLLLGAVSCARDRMVVTWLADGGFRIGELCGLRLVDLHLREQAACGQCRGPHVHICHREDNANRARVLVPGSTDTLYWGSNWGQTNGSSFRVFAWPENSGNYSWWDRTVPSYGFYTRNSGQNCASTDGVVTNWCQYADSRVLGAYRAGGLIGFSFNAKQDGSHPFPYTRFVWFNESDKNLNGSGDLWGSWGAIQFASLAPNSLGRVGLEFAWGGGTGGAHYYPGSGINSQPFNAIDTNPNYYLWGAGNTCTYAGLPRWGDYLTVRTYKADPTRWVAAGYAMKGGNCGATGAYPEPHNVLFS